MTKLSDMSNKEKIELRDQLIQGLQLAEYRMLREKAMRNQSIVIGDENGVLTTVSARETFVRLYNEPVPQF